MAETSGAKRKEIVIPPFRFGTVEADVFRSAQPTLKNFRFLARWRQSNKYCCCVVLGPCVCVVIPFVLDVGPVDTPAGVTQEEDHTGFLRLASAVLAFIFIARRICHPFPSLSVKSNFLCCFSPTNESFKVVLSRVEYLE